MLVRCVARRSEVAVGLLRRLRQRHAAAWATSIPGIVFPYSTFPIAELRPDLRRPLAYQFEVGVVRCMPTMDDDGELPPRGRHHRRRR